MRFLRSFLVWLVALVAGLLSALPTAALGLVVPRQIVFPLALVKGALLAAIAASWWSSLLAGGGLRNRLLRIVGVTVAVAVVVASLLALSSALGHPPGSLIFLLLVCMGVIALGASAVTLRLRATENLLLRDAGASLVLTALGRW